RGSAASQVAFYLDGVPLNQAQYGVVNAADLPIEALGRIEVFRGAAPLSFDAPGGGVVHLRSREDGRTWARASLGAGSFDTRKSDAAFGLTRGRTSALVVAQYLEGAGDFTYRDDNGTDAESADDTDARRANNAFVARSWTTRLATVAGPVALSLVHDRLKKAQGTPGTGANTALAAGLRSDRSLTGLLVRPGRLPGAAPRMFEPVLLVFAVRQRDRFVDPERELTGSRIDSDDRTTRDGARLVLSAGPLPDDHALEMVAETRRERFTPRSNVPAPSAGPTRTRTFVALGAEDRWSPWNGRLGLTGQLRREATFDAFPAGPAYPGALPTPASARTTRLTRGTLGARCDVLRGVGRNVSLRGSASWLGRTPTLEEMFGHRGGVHGNPQARPERLSTHDGGIVANLEFAARGAAPRWLEAQVAAYRTDATDLLVYLQNSAQTSVAQNVAAARLEGLEVAARAGWDFGLSADVSWTRQWTRDEGEVAYWRGRVLPGRPGHEASLRLAWARAAWRPFAEGHVVGAHFLDRANLQPQPERVLLDLGVAVAPRAGALEATLECRNLTDRRVFDFGGYPLPGRSFFAGLRVRFDGKDGRP
ncbi:MAG: TonB-dependent receptor, partial [Candidatus Eisenbacteria bacterium]